MGCYLKTTLIANTQGSYIAVENLGTQISFAILKLDGVIKTYIRIQDCFKN